MFEPRTLALAALHHYYNSIPEQNLWSKEPMFRLNHQSNKSFIFYLSKDRKDDEAVEVKVTIRNGNTTVTVYSTDETVAFSNCFLENTQGPKKNILFQDGRYTSSAVYKKDAIHIFYNGDHTKLYLPVPKTAVGTEHDSDHALVAPMPCKISHVQVKAGEKVKKGQTLVIVEAMKMEHVIKSPKEGTIKTVCYKLGDIVEQGKILVEYE